ncbi:MAG: hypothetical protein HRU14_11545, partial [Planctomycetes bacterium]|nr:hypothetical protein [Planctomycetota bacterium]
MRALVLAVLLGVAQWGLRPSAPATSARPVAERFSGAVHSAFLGGFRPILVQYLWWDVEAAWDEGRHHDVLENLALLERIDATNAKAILYMARFRAYTLAQAESMPSRKLGQIQTAVRLLEDAQVRLKDEVTLPLLRAMILTARWDTSDDSGEQDDLRYRRLYENWTKRRGRTPYAEALDAMEDAAVIAPNARVVRRLLSEALRYRAMELALVGSKHDEAHRFLRRAVAIDAETPGAGATLGARLIVAGEAGLDGLARSEAGSCGRGL